MKLIQRGPEPVFFSSKPFLAARAHLEKQITSGAAPDFHRFMPLMAQIRETLVRECNSRCAYCGSVVGVASVGHVEHFFPKSQFPTKAFLWGNLLLVCEACNVARGLKFPTMASGEPLLLNPTLDALSEHVKELDDGQLVGLTDKGRTTIDVFQLNRPGLVAQRNQARIAAIFDGDINEDAMNSWLAQFDESSRPIAAHLVSHFKYYSPRRLSVLLQGLHHKILEILGVQPDKLWFVPVGYVAKSGAAVAYFYRKENKIPLNRFVATNDLSRIVPKQGDAIVVLDDYVGSGHQAIHVWEHLVAPVLAKNPSTRAVFAAAIGQDSGIDKIRRNTSFVVAVADVITSADRPLSSDSRIFATEDERQGAQKILEKYGKSLSPKYPLGYADSQALVGFFYSTPNNTLPIFWASAAGWKPLLPHGESFRDPEALVGPPVGMAAGVGSTDPDRPMVEVAELDHYDIPTDITNRLLAEFKLLPVVLLFAPILKKLNVRDSVVAKFLDIVAALKYLQHEKEPVRSALMLVSDTTVLSSEDLVVTSAAGQTVENLSELRSLVQLIDGFSGAAVVRSNGEVLGNLIFPDAGESAEPYLTSRYLCAAAAARKFSALLFLFGGAGRVSVFDRGRRIVVHRNAAWHYQPAALAQGVSSLAATHGLDPAALSEVMKIAYGLSDHGHGALITVGDAEAVLGLSEPLKTGHIVWTPRDIRSVKREALLGLLASDGATVIGSDGTVLQAMTTLRPPAGTAGEVEPGKGTRHSTAAKVSAATRTVCVCVSVDGPITVYSMGKVAFKVMG